MTRSVVCGRKSEWRSVCAVSRGRLVRRAAAVMQLALCAALKDVFEAKRTVADQLVVVRVPPPPRGGRVDG
jgi:hypothetical protein